MRLVLSVERFLQVLTVLVMAFLIVYMVVYVRDARQESECQSLVNAALIESVNAARTAERIEQAAMQELVAGLLSTEGESRRLLEQYQVRLDSAASLRTENPLPNPHC